MNKEDLAVAAHLEEGNVEISFKKLCITNKPALV